MPSTGKQSHVSSVLVLAVIAVFHSYAALFLGNGYLSHEMGNGHPSHGSGSALTCTGTVAWLG